MCVCLCIANHPIADSVLSLLQATPSATGGNTSDSTSAAAGGRMQDDEIELEPVAVMRAAPSQAATTSYANLERNSSPHRAIGAGGAIGHGTALHVECGSLRYSSSSCGVVTTSVWEYCPSKCFGELKVGLELSGDCIPLQERSSPQTVSCPGLS